MHILVVSAFTLAFFALRSVAYPPEERAAALKSFLKGLALFLPAYALWSLLRHVVPNAHGSPLAVFRLGWEWFLLPTGLAGASYRFVGRYRDALESSARARSWFAHMAGVLAPLGAAVAIERFGTRNGFTLLAWPLMLPAFVACSLFLANAAYESFGVARAGIVASGVAFGFVMAIPALLTVSRLELPGFAVAAAATAVAAYFGIRRLMERREPSRYASAY